MLGDGERQDRSARAYGGMFGGRGGLSLLVAAVLLWGSAHGYNSASGLLGALRSSVARGASSVRWPELQGLQQDLKNAQARYIPRADGAPRTREKRALPKARAKGEESEWLSGNQLQRELLPYAVTLFLGSSVSVLFQALEPLELLFGAEGLFLTYCALLYETTMKHPIKPEPWEHDKDWPTMWREVLESVPDAKAWFTSWFLGKDASWEAITKEDAASFLSWAMFSTTPEALRVKQRQEVNLAVKQIEAYTQHKFPQRREGAAPLRSMRATIEPLRAVHKPLLFYLVTQGLFGLGMAKELGKMNFEEHWHGDFRYFVHKKKADEHSTTTSGEPPIIFFHGVGGLAAYLPLVRGMTALGRDVVVVEMPYVSLHVAPNVPSIDAHVDLFRALMHSHFSADSKAVLIGHSWGSNVISWLIKAEGAERVSRAVFLDPVCCMLHLKDITFKWFFDSQYPENSHATVQKADPPLVSVASLVTLVKTELFVVNTLQRHLVWHRNELFASTLQDKGIPALVVVSSSDHIVPAVAVLGHVQAHEQACAAGGRPSLVRAAMLDGSDHGGMVFEEKFREQTLALIKKELEGGSGSGGEGAGPIKTISASAKNSVGAFV